MSHIVLYSRNYSRTNSYFPYKLPYNFSVSYSDLKTVRIHMFGTACILVRGLDPCILQLGFYNRSILIFHPSFEEKNSN